MHSDPVWTPQHVRRVDRVLGTSMHTAEVVTDAGPAYLKALGNPEGPHALAAEWIGSQLARWFGLRTFDFALINFDQTVPIELSEGDFAQSGAAFVCRKEEGHTWGGSGEELDRIENSVDVPRLIVFDTWVRNCDRYSRRLGVTRRNYDNVFFSTEGTPPGRFCLKAMDHTHCFTCGHPIRPSIANIDTVQDASLYGGFPPFERYHDMMVWAECRDKLLAAQANVIRPIVESVPAEWDLNNESRNALISFLIERAAFLAQLGPDYFRPTNN